MQRNAFHIRFSLQSVQVTQYQRSHLIAYLTVVYLLIFCVEEAISKGHLVRLSEDRKDRHSV